jgi:flagellar hook-length control protein FliK
VAAQAAEAPVKIVVSSSVSDAKTAAPADTAPVSTAAVQAAALADQASSGKGETSQGGQGQSSAEVLTAAALDPAPKTDAPVIPTTTTPIAANAQAALPIRAEVRGSPETVAKLSADILKKLDAQTTRFDVALTPDGLGKVDVRIEIARNGALSAHMNFDTAQAAAELRNKSGELRQALSQAGFNVADNALSFDVSSQNGGQNGQNAFFNFSDGGDGRRAFSGKAFQSALNDEPIILSPSDLLPGLRMAPDSGLDIRI